MPGEEKKKANPGILDWIADFLVTPIKTSISGLLQPIIGHPNVKERAELEKSVQTLYAALSAAATHSPLASPGLTPDDQKTSLEKWAVTGHNNSMTAWIATIAAETASLGLNPVQPSADPRASCSW